MGQTYITMAGVAALTVSLASVAHSGEQRIVSGKSGPNRWIFVVTPGASDNPVSKDADLDDPTGRLVVRAKDGDTVLFRTESGSHGVIFEHAQAELAGGVWEVVPGSGKLEDVDLTDPDFKAFKAGAQMTKPVRSKPIIEIRIKGLKPGLKQGILFGCNPHSATGEAKGQEMLGVIVLDEGKASPR